jgi:hypothetical protein
MSNIHAALIKNATDMQSQLLQFSHQLSNLSLKSLDDQDAFKMASTPSFAPAGSNRTGTDVSFNLQSSSGPVMTVNIPSSGIPSEVSSGSSATDPQKAVAKAMAVVAMNLRGVGVGVEDIEEIFKNGITPTSLAAVESQLKGHHDSVLQLSLESLSRVTNILQKIAQKLGS